jgi:hypothetical protein
MGDENENHMEVVSPGESASTHAVGELFALRFWGLDQGAGHSIRFGLFHGSLRRTERRWRDLNGCQDRRKH